MRLILAVTNDEYELITYMAENYRQMSLITGCHKDTVRRQCKGTPSSTGIKYVEVFIDDE